MADHDDGGRQSRQRLFQPFDGGQVEMVGRLVDQQHVRLGSHGAHQRHPARLAAGKARGIGIVVDAKLAQQRPATIGIVGRPQARLDIGQHRFEAGQVGLLRQIGDARAGVGEALAFVGLHQPGGNLQQRRFARAVAADEADALAPGNADFGAG